MQTMRGGGMQVFSKDENGMPRSWGPRVNIPAVNQQARLAAAQLLAQLAVIRLNATQARLSSAALHIIWKCAVPASSNS
jgi:hypothetical protein